jgi:hypothetical protein
MEPRVTASSPLDTLWLTEAVRLREEHAGRLDDAEANRIARAGGGDLAQRIVQRALWLARHNGLASALGHWRQGARLAAWAMALLAVISGASMAFAALGNGPTPVNVFWALGSLLGLNLIMLLGWLLGLLFAGEHTASLGRLWWWLSGKLARDAQAAHLAPALVLLLQRQRLNRWAIGRLVHGLWLLALFAALVLVVLLLATRRYGFVWETTILPAESFIALTQALGWLPGLLGFNGPDPAMIRASGDVALAADGARQAWAAWLLGVLVVYGLAPRLLLGLFCEWRWRHGRGRLALDLNAPGYSQLREQLMPASERLGVTDPAPSALPVDGPVKPLPEHNGAILAGLELDSDLPWPPTLPTAISDAGQLDDRASRQRLLEQLAHFPAARLVIACDPRRSPDRGTLGLIAELARSASATRVWLLQPPAGQSLDARRLAAWHETLAPLQLTVSEHSPLGWLENGHD